MMALQMATMPLTMAMTHRVMASKRDLNYGKALAV